MHSGILYFPGPVVELGVKNFEQEFGIPGHVGPVFHLGAGRYDVVRGGIVLHLYGYDTGYSFGQRVVGWRFSYVGSSVYFNALRVIGRGKYH